MWHTSVSVGNKMHDPRARTAEDRTLISSSSLHLKSDVIITICLSCWNRKKIMVEQANAILPKYSCPSL